MPFFLVYYQSIISSKNYSKSSYHAKKIWNYNNSINNINIIYFKLRFFKIQILNKKKLI